MVGGEILATDVMYCSDHTMMAGSHTKETHQVLTFVVGIITLPIMATVWLEITVLRRAESVSFGLVVLCVENGRV